MTEITLTSDQIQLFANATDGVIFRDPSGNVIVRVPPVCDEKEAATMTEAKRRLATEQPRRPSADVLARLGRREAE